MFTCILSFYETYDSMWLNKMKIILSFLLLFAVAVFAQEAKIFQTGIASYYSRKSNGARTSSGERLNSDSLVLFVARIFYQKRSQLPHRR